MLFKSPESSRRRVVLGQAIESLESRVLLAYSLDPSFSGDGVAEGQGTRGFAVQADDKIVAIVNTSPGIRRVNTDGSPDTTFGLSGKVATPFTPVDLLISGGKILVASTDFRIARYNSNGTLDTTFGGGDGIAEAPTEHGMVVSDLALAPGGKLVLFGSGSESPDPNDIGKDRAYNIVARFNADGTLDNSFSGDGVSEEVVADLHYGGLMVGGVQSDGKIVLTGWSVFSPMDGQNVYMWRLNSDGSPDATFKQQVWHNLDVRDVEIQGDNKILLAIDYRVEHYNADGTVDSAFNTNSLGTELGDIISGVQPLSDGKILVGGGTDSGSPFVARLLANGNVDPTFTIGDRVWLHWGVQDVRPDSHNRVIASSYANTDGNALLQRLADLPQSPFKGTPFQVGQTIQAEDFDIGGEGVAYHDTDARNVGAYYRTSEGVDIQPTGDVGGGYNVGWANGGEWLEYTINIPTAGEYLIDTRVASPKGGGSFHYEIDGRRADVDVSIPNTGSYQTWQTITSTLGTTPHPISAGTHILRLFINQPVVSGPVANFNWMKISATSTGDTQAPSAVPNFHTTNVSNSSVSLAWDAATDNVGVTGYQLTLDPNSTVLLGPDQHSFTFPELAPDHQYTFSIYAIDAAGNHGPTSQVSATTGSLPVTGGLKGEYFNNMDFTAPVLTRTDANIDFNWGTGAPASGMDPDTFSVRWTGKIQVPTTGRYTFYTTTDDGVRLWINNQLLIDKFVPQAATEWSGSIDLVAGQKYDIRMDYFERAGGAQAKLSWSGPGIAKQIVPPSAFSSGSGSGDTQPPSAVVNFTTTRIGTNSIDLRWDGASDNNGVAGFDLRIDDGAPIVLGPSARTYTASNLQPQTTYKFTIDAFDAAGNRGPATTIFVTTAQSTSTTNGLMGTYFNNMDFTSPAFTRRDPTINFNWGGNSPDPVTMRDPDTFSIRWTGQIQAPATGRYTFYTTSDDGMRLTINGQRIIDKLVPQSTTEWSGSIDLVAGQKYSIVVEYIERFGSANAKLQWAGPNISKQVVPEANLFS